MYYDRKEVKRAAKATIRATHPKPIWITFAYLMMVSLISFLVLILCLVPYFTFLGALRSGVLTPRDAMFYVGGLPLLMIFVLILVSLYAMVMQFGYCQYVINVKRDQPSGFRDLFSGFSRVGRVLMLNLLIFVFCFLWSLAGTVIIMIPMGLASLFHSDVLTGFMGFVTYIALLAFLFNRTLRYAPALLIMVDHPELTAREALNESKAIMKGNLWKLFVFELSFIGWSILCVLIAYAVLFPGMFAIMALAPAAMYNPAVVIVPFILICALAFIVTSLLAMWVNAYQSVAFVGFYDAINGFNRPAAPANDVLPSVPTFTPPVTDSPIPLWQEPIRVAEPEPPIQEEPTEGEPAFEDDSASEDSFNAPDGNDSGEL